MRPKPDETNVFIDEKELELFLEEVAFVCDGIGRFFM
jgi:hypothetical protein